MSLRERKKERTRERLVDEALRLFAVHGYEETSVEDIAAAADVSPRTFFRYFPTKSDVVFADLPIRLAAVESALREGGAVHESVRDVLLSSTNSLTSDTHLAAVRTRLVLENAALRTRLLEFFAAVEALIAKAYASRHGIDASSLQARLAAAITVAAGRSAMLAAGTRDPRPLLDESFARTAPAVRRVLRG